MSLIGTTVKNIGFVYTSTAVARALGLVSTIILARLLFPADFGILALAGFVTGLISQFSDFGIGMALVQRKDNVDAAKNAAFFMYIIMGVLLYLTAFFAAPFAAQFFNEPVIQQVIRIAGIGLIINSTGVVNRWLLYKELKFKKNAIVDVSCSTVTTVITIILAFHGFSFWSIVYGSLAGNVFEVLLLWAVNPWRPKLKFDEKIAKELIHFGKYIVISTMLLFFILNIDNVIAGRVLGTVFVGYYTLAFKFGNYSTTLIAHVGTVIFSTFAKMQDELERLKKAYLMQLKYVSMISIPMAFGTLAIATEFVTIVLGEKWTPIIPILQILCFCGLFRSLQIGAGSIFYAVGKPQYRTKILGIELLGILFFIYPMTLWYGLIGLSVLMTLGRFFELIYALALANKILDLPFVSQIKNNFIKPLLSSVIMLIAIYLLRTFAFNNISLLLHSVGDVYINIFFFILLIGIGALIYFISMYIFTNGELFEEMKRLISMIRSQ